MPDDKLKRLSNLLTQMQFRTALESTSNSTTPKDTYALQRMLELNTRDKGISKYHAEQLEKQGEQTNPVTNQKNKYSERWLQSTGQQVPGLDSEGQSALDALDVTQLPGLAKVVGAIGREGIKRGIGRVATNIINTSSENLSSSLKNIKFKDAIKAIWKDKPLELAMEDEVPYRLMFGLKPRSFTAMGTQATKVGITTLDDIYAYNPDGSLRFKPNSQSYQNIKRNMIDKLPPKEYVLGHYNQTGNRYWDKWDVDLNPGELKRNLKTIIGQKTPEDIYGLNSTSIQNYNSIPKFAPEKVITPTGEINQSKLALEKTKAILRLLERAAVRKTVNYFSDPVVIQGTIKGVR